ncbi:PREDICTED: MANSC domain-containing protein 1 [Nanorana parkeri]|uniref:MANSC domain-containing protein 1 n=1 Tax=Nanorana parkeri TaxID=125878 RepID=UPI0008543CC1|nr:PREDICTED: MANSC domain-containing protein 1 [Nanorana parkeri]
MFVFTPHLIWALLLPVLLSADSSAPGFSECVPDEIPNMVVDVPNSVAKGARFTDPLNAANAEECASACCSKLNSLGEQTCNLAVYDNRIRNALQNCYLFFCPKPESCPMTQSRGVVSFSFWTAKEKSNLDLTEDLLESPKSKNNGKVQNSSHKKSSAVVQGTFSPEPEFEERLSQHDDAIRKDSPSDESQSNMSEVKPLTKEDKANTPDHITSKLLHLANNIDKQLEKIEASSKNVKDSEEVELSVSPSDEEPLVEPTTSSRHKDSKKLSSDSKDTKSINKKPETLEIHYPTPKLIASIPSVRTSQQISKAAHRPIPNTKPTIVSSTAPTRQSKVTKKAPGSDIKGTKVLSNHNSANSFITAVTAKNLQAGHLIKTTQVPTSSAVYQAKSTLPVKTSLLKTAKSTLKDGDHTFTNKDMQEADRSVPELTSPEGQDPSPTGDTKEVPRNLDALNTNLGDSDKSGLVAALVFGVMFLVLIIGLVSHKVSEARRRHQYTKLDYLINGMYVDT